MFVLVVFGVVLVLVEATGIVESWLEGSLMALAMALSSTSVISSMNYHSYRLEYTVEPCDAPLRLEPDGKAVPS